MTQQILAFMAPIAAVIIGIIGLKYLFGDQRSLAGFIGFLFLGMVVFALIRWGDAIVRAIGDLISSNPGIVAFVTFVVAVVVVVSVWWVRHEAEPPTPEIAPVNADHFDAAQAALGELAPRDLRAVDRLKGQLRLALIIAEERGLFEPGSPVAPAHLTKWVVLRDTWPGVVEGLWEQPNLLKVLEESRFEEFRDVALVRFLRAGPSLQPVAQHLLYMTPVIEEAG